MLNIIKNAWRAIKKPFSFQEYLPAISSDEGGNSPMWSLVIRTLKSEKLYPLWWFMALLMLEAIIFGIAVIATLLSAGAASPLLVAVATLGFASLVNSTTIGAAIAAAVLVVFPLFLTFLCSFTHSRLTKVSQEARDDQYSFSPRRSFEDQKPTSKPKLKPNSRREGNNYSSFFSGKSGSAPGEYTDNGLGSVPPGVYDCKTDTKIII